MKVFQINKMSSDTCGNSDIEKVYFVKADSIIEIVNKIPGKITSYEKNGFSVDMHTMGSGGYGTWIDNPLFNPAKEIVEKTSYVKKSIGLGYFDVREIKFSSFAEVK